MGFVAFCHMILLGFFILQLMQKLFGFFLTRTSFKEERMPVLIL